jgi:hypothetical protein
MSDRDFWKCTPRRLDALYEKHLEINGVEMESSDEPSQEDSVKSVMSW